MAVEIAHGLHVETLGDILEQGEAAPPPAAFALPRLPEYAPTFPAPGI